jgi:hypothetical protein
VMRDIGMGIAFCLIEARTREGNGGGDESMGTDTNTDGSEDEVQERLAD